MRTIKRHSKDLNKGKYLEIKQTAQAYANEKQRWLFYFQSVENIHFIDGHRLVRNEFVQAGYRSSFGLQARMWKLALIDAAETMDKYWQALFVEVRKLISKNDYLSEEQKHYCFWILKDYQRFQSFFSHRYPTFKGLSTQEITQAGNYLHRIIDRKRGAYPKVKLARSFVLDANCYSIFEENDCQYVKVMTLE